MALRRNSPARNPREGVVQYIKKERKKHVHDHDVGFPTVYRGIYCRNLLTLSNQTSRYIPKCIRIVNYSDSDF